MKLISIILVLLAACSSRHASIFDGLPVGGACSGFDDSGVAQCAGGGQLFTCVYAGSDRAVCASGTAPRLQHDTTVMPMPIPMPVSTGQ
jgi:hypothetical protein